jgi:hypothetical protein
MGAFYDSWVGRKEELAAVLTIVRRSWSSSTSADHVGSLPPWSESWSAGWWPHKSR